MKRIATSSIAITDPLVKYQSLLATGLCLPDPSQHRLAVHLQKIYHRLKDYSPTTEYRSRLETIKTTLENSRSKEAAGSAATLAVKSHPIWGNPLFARFVSRTEAKDTLALTRVLTSHDAAITINSPRGFFLSGEVGTGKSMLLDLLVEGLPTSRKKRWHFNTFMLYALSQLERHRQSCQRIGSDDQQYSLLWMAKEMIETSPILFLDEFQLPDRAASKILSNLFIVFFQLGGVLVASSNRMPEELEKATGVEYIPPSQRGFINRTLGLRPKKAKGELFGSTSDFASFLEVLKARCEFWQIEGGQDWRRRDADEFLGHQVLEGIDITSNVVPIDVAEGVLESHSQNKDIPDPNTNTRTPQHYILRKLSDNPTWEQVLGTLTGNSGQVIPWTSSTLTVYGRTVKIPNQYNGISYWTFSELVSAYGPADYITMASNFHTFIVDEIPVLTVLKKNEARRLITFLDALYEARCKLVVRAEAGPDDLFFPESKSTTRVDSKSSHKATRTVDNDAILSETIAEVFQDQMLPFRPNISTYTDPSHDPANTAYDPDVDSDFGVEQKSPRLKPDFSNTGAFTGEDERFAYKRAASRLWEMCGTRWHARTGDWWRPLPIEARHWEGSSATRPLDGQPFGQATESKPRGDVTMGQSIELDEPVGLQRLRIEYLKNTLLGGAKEPADDKRAADRFARSKGQLNDGFE